MTTKIVVDKDIDTVEEEKSSTEYRYKSCIFEDVTIMKKNSCGCMRNDHVKKKKYIGSGHVSVIFYRKTNNHKARVIIGEINHEYPKNWIDG